LLKDLYNIEFDVIEVERIDDGVGSYIENEIVRSAANKGLVEPIGGEERFQMQKVEAVAEYRLFCDLVVDIDEANRVRINGKIYEVMDLRRYDLGVSKHQEIYLKIIK